MCLGYRRLSIIDLSPRATQPMHSSCGRCVVVDSGEIYNLAELRREREAAGDRIRTTSDTAVLLSMCAADGETMLSKLRSMFAFVIWDRLAKRAFVARAPYGIKTLNYARLGGGVPLASQIKTLLATATVSRAADPQGRVGLWLLGSVSESALPASLARWSRVEFRISVNVWTARPSGVSGPKGRRNWARVVLQAIGAPTG